VVLVVIGLRVGVAIDGLQCPLGILKLHLCVFLLLGVDLLLALPLVGWRAILALLHLFMELFREFLDLPTLHRGMARGVVHRALRATVVAIGWLTGAFVTSRTTTAPTRRCSCSSGRPASGWLPPAFFFLLLLPSLPLPPPGAWAPALGVVLSPFAAWAAGECQARPSIALAHLSGRLKSADTSWMSWVVSFSSIFSSLITWRNANTTEALEIRGMVLRT
jgi:hypothetical protein